jgi:hypothetical protein
MKSSLKTFLAGKNGFGYNKGTAGILCPKLEDSWPLSAFCDDMNLVDDNGFYIPNPNDINDRDAWFTDVLDDGTAITYCRD